MRQTSGRTIQGRAFGEDAFFIRNGPGSYDANNRWVSGSKTRTPIRLSSWPTSTQQGLPRAISRKVEPEGERQSLRRIFALLEGDAVDATKDPRPIRADTWDPNGRNYGTDGDQIEYEGDLYRLREVHRYGRGIVECIGVWQESNP